MKLESFKFQDGKVFWLPEYPDEPKWHDLGPRPDTSDYEIRDEQREDYNKAVAHSLASAIEVAPEDVNNFKLLWERTYRGVPMSGEVYSAECEMETGYQWKTSSGYIPVGKVIYDYWSKSSSKSGRQVAYLKSMKEHLSKLNESNRDWPEDYSQENGNYQNKCCLCGLLFYGNKHRVVCKICTSFEDWLTLEINELENIFYHTNRNNDFKGILHELAYKIKKLYIDRSKLK